ncbi:MAG: hypothetical protein IJ853_02410 [Rickettsiales bacterium]|nr:hypothetical protein [Rickettsiales bacterium]
MILKINNSNFGNFSTKRYLYLFLLLLLCQVIFWFKFRTLEQELEVVSTPPSENTMKAFTFGDDEFYFRFKSFEVQNMGDTFGRFTSLKKYDYNKLYGWFKELEKLNYVSNYLPSLAAYYFSQTPKIEDRRYIVKFLQEHALKDLEKKWWWLYQASFIANYDLKDKDLAVSIASKLKDVKNAPVWAKQTAGIYLAQSGNSCEAIRVMSEVVNDLENSDEKDKKKKEEELDYMEYFINRELEKLKEKGSFDLDQCFNNKTTKE